jgi:hypothetical protein
MVTKLNRAIAAAAAVSIALTAFGLSPAAAQPLATEVGYRNDGGAAALGAFAAIAGTIAVIAASHHDRGPAYAVPYGYGYAPAPYAYAPRYGSDGGGWHRWHGWRGHWHGR